MPRYTSTPVKTPPTRAVLIRVGALAFVVLVAAFVAYRLGWLDYRRTLQHVNALRASSGVVGFSIAFISVYALATAAGIPGMPFTVAAGALFGTGLGSVLSWIGAMIGATIGYWIARTIGRQVVTNWLKRFKRVDAAVQDARGFDGMFRLRLIPVLPMGTVSFVGGLARVPFLPYLAATAAGVIPSIAIYSYFAHSLVEGLGSGKSDALTSLVIASALLIALSLAPRWLNRGKRPVLPSEPV